MTKLQDDYTAAKGWATAHVLAALAITAAVFLTIGLLIG